MAFIKVQKLVRNEEGEIQSGSAAIVDTTYDKSVPHGVKHSVVEKLGKVLFYDKSLKVGIFDSPTRGLVEYSSATNTFSDVSTTDPRLPKHFLPREPLIHTVFGDVWFLLNFLKNNGLLDILTGLFTKQADIQRLVCHVLHGVLKDGSRISCEDFITKSFASYLTKDISLHSLKSDTEFFAKMGNDSVKMQFFQRFISLMRSQDPFFGKGCYLDSTALPNDIKDNPFNALCCHGVGSSEVMMRLVLVIDDKTGLPVWYNVIPGNVLDVNTIMSVVNDVSTSLEIEISSFVLDAGYISKDLITACNIGTEKIFIGRMPARKGYPYKTLYHEVKKQIPRGKYFFTRNNSNYFGKKKEIEIFGKREYAYIYVDKFNAESKLKKYCIEHLDEFNKLNDAEKDWYMVKFGFFILLSNIDSTPEDILDLYFSRINIEKVFKTSKQYLDLLPLNKWTDATVRGKILTDIINTIIVLMIRKTLNKTATSTQSLFGKLSSLICVKRGDKVFTDPPSKQVKDYLKFFEMETPNFVHVSEWQGLLGASV